jgi:hypothetical protein
MSNTRNLSKFAADVPTTIGNAGQFLKVNTGASAFEWSGVGDTLPSGATAGQVLKRNAGNTDYEWADAAENPSVTFPSDWGSPTNTYSTSGTWSKGSLADTDYVWFYLLSGGSPGNRAYSGLSGYGGPGGTAVLCFGTAATFDGASYVVGAGSSALNGGQYNNLTYGNATTLTLTSANGSTVYGSASTGSINLVNINTATSNIVGGETWFTSPNVPQLTLSTGSTTTYGYLLATQNTWSNGSELNQALDTYKSVFCGGMGGYQANSGNASVGAGSVYAGAGGAPRSNGTYPGGAGGASNNSGSAGSGAAGNVRVYHV